MLPGEMFNNFNCSCCSAKEQVFITHNQANIYNLGNHWWLCSSMFVGAACTMKEKKREKFKRTHAVSLSRHFSFMILLVQCDGTLASLSKRWVSTYWRNENCINIYKCTGFFGPAAHVLNKIMAKIIIIIIMIITHMCATSCGCKILCY